LRADRAAWVVAVLSAFVTGCAAGIDRATPSASVTAPPQDLQASVPAGVRPLTRDQEEVMQP